MNYHLKFLDSPYMTYNSYNNYNSQIHHKQGMITIHCKHQPAQKWQQINDLIKRKKLLLASPDIQMIQTLIKKKKKSENKKDYLLFMQHAVKNEMRVSPHSALHC